MLNASYVFPYSPARTSPVILSTFADIKNRLLSRIVLIQPILHEPKPFIKA